VLAVLVFGAGGDVKTPAIIAWECAWVLLQDFRDRLTPDQFLTCWDAYMRGPERADLDCIALACRVIGTRT